MDFSNVAMGDRGADAVAGFLENSKCATLDLSSANISCKGGKKILAALRHDGCRVRTLDLSYNDLTDAFPIITIKTFRLSKKLKVVDLTRTNMNTKGAKNLARALKETTSLKTLLLGGNNIRTRGMVALSQALVENKSLTHLDVSENNIKAGACRALSGSLLEAKRLKSLDLSMNPLGYKAFRFLGKTLEVIKTLQRLDVSSCMLGSEGVSELCHSLRKNEGLKHLDLSRNDMHDIGAEAVGGMLQDNKILRSIELFGNGISAKGGLAIATGIKVNEGLKSVDLSMNPISDNGCGAISNAVVVNSRIRTLDLPWCRFGDMGCISLSMLLEKESCKVKSLNLAFNSITDTGVVMLCDVLAASTTLLYVSFTGNRLTARGVRAIIELASKNHHIRDIELFPLRGIGDHLELPLQFCLQVNQLRKGKTVEPSEVVDILLESSLTVGSLCFSKALQMGLPEETIVKKIWWRCHKKCAVVHLSAMDVSKLFHYELPPNTETRVLIVEECALNNKALFTLLKNFPDIVELHISNNLLRGYPWDIVQHCRKLRAIYWGGNPLPSYLLRLAPEDVPDFLRSQVHREVSMSTNNEVRLFVFGQRGSGKSSLCRSLRRTEPPQLTCCARFWSCLSRPQQAEYTDSPTSWFSLSPKLWRFQSSGMVCSYALMDVPSGEPGHWTDSTFCVGLSNAVSLILVRADEYVHEPERVVEEVRGWAQAVETEVVDTCGHLLEVMTAKVIVVFTHVDHVRSKTVDRLRTLCSGVLSTFQRLTLVGVYPVVAHLAGGEGIELLKEVLMGIAPSCGVSLSPMVNDYRDQLLIQVTHRKATTMTREALLKDISDKVFVDLGMAESLLMDLRMTGTVHFASSVGDIVVLDPQWLSLLRSIIFHSVRHDDGNCVKQGTGVELADDDAAIDDVISSYRIHDTDLPNCIETARNYLHMLLVRDKLRRRRSDVVPSSLELPHLHWTHGDVVDALRTQCSVLKKAIVPLFHGPIWWQPGSRKRGKPATVRSNAAFEEVYGVLIKQGFLLLFRKGSKWEEFMSLFDRTAVPQLQDLVAFIPLHPGNIFWKDTGSIRGVRWTVSVPHHAKTAPFSLGFSSWIDSVRWTAHSYNCVRNLSGIVELPDEYENEFKALHTKNLGSEMWIQTLSASGFIINCANRVGALRVVSLGKVLSRLRDIEDETSKIEPSLGSDGSDIDEDDAVFAMASRPTKEEEEFDGASMATSDGGSWVSHAKSMDSKASASTVNARSAVTVSSSNVVLSRLQPGTADGQASSSRLTLNQEEKSYNVGASWIIPQLMIDPEVDSITLLHPIVDAYLQSPWHSTCVVRLESTAANVFTESLNPLLLKHFLDSPVFAESNLDVLFGTRQMYVRCRDSHTILVITLSSSFHNSCVFTVIQNRTNPFPITLQAAEEVTRRTLVESKGVRALMDMTTVFKNLTKHSYAAEKCCLLCARTQDLTDRSAVGQSTTPINLSRRVELEETWAIPYFCSECTSLRSERDYELSYLASIAHTAAFKEKPRRRQRKKPMQFDPAELESY